MLLLNILSPRLAVPNHLHSNKSSAKPPFDSKIQHLSFCTKINKLSVKCCHSEYYDQQQQFSSTLLAPSPEASRPQPPSGVGGMPSKVFVGHSIYKGKAALTVEPKALEFLALDSGVFKLAGDGYVLLQFAPAAGVPTYDWGRKQIFSLSVTEIGTLIALGARESCEFFHDPNNGKRYYIFFILLIFTCRAEITFSSGSYGLSLFCFCFLPLHD
ncbi:single-stranded DNA-binding protein WHY1 chloroplastic [Tripterygium wilfordii]|uniref:Single-stranded DNA-binding protein WHY1 chloroplastic n=1 Tax=Tripterygium wilfordii TaxID=458696 RepID=A0A7J7D411_TRIWF|nr:single-stranded DNA-binding protein WHY1 chloroplastic [Tripterygium wilfordii]